jgi:hypothetical protein
MDWERGRPARVPTDGGPDGEAGETPAFQDSGLRRRAKKYARAFRFHTIMLRK